MLKSKCNIQMKRLFFIFPIMLCAALPACKKTSGPADGNSVQKNNKLDSTVSMNAVINGRNWQTDSVFGYYVKYSGNDSGLVSLQITGTQLLNDTASTIIFYINRYNGPNTYIINPPVNTATYYIGSKRNYADSGVVIITSDTAYALKGTFSFKVDTALRANGTFNVALP